MVHLWWQVQERLSRAYSIELDRVSMRDQGVFLPVKEEAWALGLCNQVNVAEAFVDNDREETRPPKQAPSSVFDAHVGRHEKQRVSVLSRSQI